MPPKKSLKNKFLKVSKEEEVIIEMTAEDVLVDRNKTLPVDAYYEISEAERKKIENDITTYRAKTIDNVDRVNDIMEIKDLDIYIHRDFLFNNDQDKPNALLHAEFVDGYYQLLQKKYPQNLYFTTHFIQNYDDDRKPIEKGSVDEEEKKPIGKKIVIEIEDGNFDLFLLFLNSNPKRRKTKVDMMDKMLDMIAADEKDRKVFFPVFVDTNHFAVLVLDVKFKALVYYDSILYGKNKTTGMTDNAEKYLYLVTDFIKNYLKYKEFAGESKVEAFLKDMEHRLIQYDNSPQQKNGYDCGVYTCALGYLISADKRIPEPKKKGATFTKKQVQNMRLRIKESFVKGEITP